MRWLRMTMLLAIAPSCLNQARIKAETTVADLLVSPEQERQIGKEIHAQLLKQGMKSLQDDVVVDYVERIADRLGGEVDRQERIADLQVFVVDAPDVVNAMATPGGYLYVYSGLLIAADDEAEVAGVVGHEIGHIVARHAARQMVYAYGYDALAGLALGKDPSLLAQIGAQVAGQGFMLANSRADENEADDLGLVYLHRGGWDPRGLPRFFTTLKKQEGRVPKAFVWLSSHPTTDTRIENLQEVIEKRGWDEGKTNAPAHRRIVKRLSGRGGQALVQPDAPGSDADTPVTVP